MVLNIFAVIVIILLVGLAIWLVVLLGNMPGNIARSRHHPQVEAITALSWIGLITMGVGWFVAMVWAYYKPQASEPELRAQVAELTEQLQQLQTGGDKS